MAVTRPYRPNSLVPDIVPSKDSPLDELNAQCEVGLRFYNGMRHGVTVIFRSGLELQIPPVMGLRSNSFFIRNIHQLNSSVIVDTRRLLDDGRKYASNVAENFHRAFERSPVPRSRGLFAEQRSVDFELTKQQFDENGGIIYLENLDVLVSILNPSYTPRHPFTVGAYSDALLEIDPSLHELNSFHYRITIIDSGQRFGSRFININGIVYHIPAIHNSQLADGVYVIRTLPTQGALAIQLPGANCYDFTTAEKELGLWRSYTEALTLGDPNSVLKRKYEEASNDAAMALVEAKRQSQEAAARNEQERREQELEHNRIKHDLVLREAEIERREQEMRRSENELKHRLEILRKEQDIREKIYETGSLKRKERIEWLKVIPITIGAVGTIAAAIKALKTK